MFAQVSLSLAAACGCCVCTGVRYGRWQRQVLPLTLARCIVSRKVVIYTCVRVKPGETPVEALRGFDVQIDRCMRV